MTSPGGEAARRGVTTKHLNQAVRRNAALRKLIAPQARQRRRIGF
jgi:hypothetical protein